MTEKEVRNRIGVKTEELVETNKGLLDLVKVENDKVHYGFLGGGGIQIEPVDDFLAHFSVLV